MKCVVTYNEITFLFIQISINKQKLTLSSIDYLYRILDNMYIHYIYNYIHNIISYVLMSYAMLLF